MAILFEARKARSCYKGGELIVTVVGNGYNIWLLVKVDHLLTKEEMIEKILCHDIEYTYEKAKEDIEAGYFVQIGNFFIGYRDGDASLSKKI